VPFTTLPNELLGAILRRAWADRPPRPAAEEVRAAAGLASVCRRMRELLRAAPLPLALDFSAAPSSDAQRRWLLGPARAGRVEAAKFCVVSNEDEEPFPDILWERPLLDRFLARHGGALLQLSGVPLQLVACGRRHMARPALDLSGLRLTKLGITCCDINAYRYDCEFLWPEYMPSTLEELDLLGLSGLMSDLDMSNIAWAPRLGPGVGGWLPRLHTLRLTAGDVAYKPASSVSPWLGIDNPPLLEGLASLPHLEVDGSGAAVEGLEVQVFNKVRSARVVSGGHVELWADEEDAAMAAERLCHARLQAAELCAERDGIRIFRLVRGDKCDVECAERLTRELVLKMITRCGDRFAVEVEFPEVPPDGRHRGKARLTRLAWRRWPAPGAPNLPAARFSTSCCGRWPLRGCCSAPPWASRRPRTSRPPPVPPCAEHAEAARAAAGAIRCSCAGSLAWTVAAAVACARAAGAAAAYSRHRDVMRSRCRHHLGHATGKGLP